MNKFHCLNISKRFNSNEELKESIINFFDKTMALYHLLDSDYRISYLKDNDILFSYFISKCKVEK